GLLANLKTIENRSGPAYGWMKEHRVGYHYWAGVYNNQNTYLAPWFLAQHKADDDVWMKLADGKVLRGGGGDWGPVNVWNPQVQEYVRDYSEAQARALRNDPWLVCYDYTAEPHPWAAQPPEPPHQAQYSGYNESAISAFRAPLRKKFGTIARLNKSWNSDYASFTEIQPPPDPYVSLPAKASPL